MACCGGINEKGEDLNGKAYPELSLKIDNNKFKFASKEGQFILEENTEHEETEKEKSLMNEINNLKKEYENGENQLNDINKKIKEIEGKIAAMEKVLNVDISEKNYLQYLEKKIKNDRVSEN
jgi:predicted  nucleic acid-binding Zn-ribbon protein